ncbi:MAG: NAD(P)H-hydrate dehydratase [Deltaproteobacteria bacterium]|nr:NAD(P)H-hydrate dehydratase [Deltaproteobacteria bacterium]
MRRSPNKQISKPKVALVDARLLRRWPIPAPPSDGDKEGRGRVLIVGGARQLPGAVILAATAALRAGAGKLRIITTAGVATPIAVAIPEAFVQAVPEARDGGFVGRCESKVVPLCLSSHAIVLGPGMIENRALAPLVLSILKALTPEHAVVLDAGALTVLGDHRQRVGKLRCQLVVTPHAGEMAKLLGQDKDAIKGNALATVQAVAKELNAITILKGVETLISDGTTTYRNVAGNSGLATSGSGDTLAGLIGGLIARGASAFQAAVWGVHLHARAGDVLARKLAPLGYLPRELLREIPALMAGYGKYKPR